MSLLGLLGSVGIYVLWTYYAEKGLMDWQTWALVVFVIIAKFG